jgi:hypothetical protein
MSDSVRWEVAFAVSRPGKPDVTNAVILTVEYAGKPVEWEPYVGPAIAKAVREADLREQQAMEDTARAHREMADTIDVMRAWRR